jgi:hypothetical protein
MQSQNTVFRFKFTPNFISELTSFSKLHQYDDIHTYKDMWKTWLSQNDILIQTEIQNHKLQGYQGDVIDKMYKSGRYYFRNKNKPVMKNPQQRRKYISINPEIIDLMDQHINYNVNTVLFKPSTSYEQFCIEYKDYLDKESDRIIELNLQITSEEINSKFKKTYKNRYFEYVKKNKHILPELIDRNDNEI